MVKNRRKRQEVNNKTSLEGTILSIFLVCQPIFDIETENVEGYALLYREKAAVAGEEATNETFSRAISQLFTGKEGTQMMQGNRHILHLLINCLMKISLVYSAKIN